MSNKSKKETFWDQLKGDDMKNALVSVLPKYMDYGRFISVVISQARIKLKDHANLITSSILVAAYEGAQCGLSFEPSKGEAYMVPYKCKIGKDAKGKNVYGTIITFIPGYRGLIKLCRNAGLKDIYARVVYEKDEFEYYEDDLGQHIKYRPTFDEKRGPAKCAFDIAVLKDGTRSVHIEPYHKILKIKRQAKAQDGPWKHWEEEMAKKTVLRHHCKLLESDNDQLNRATKLDEMYEELGTVSTEIPPQIEDIVDADYTEVTDKIRKQRDKEFDSSKPEIIQETTEKKSEPKPEEKKEEKQPDSNDAPPVFAHDDYLKMLRTTAFSAGYETDEAIDKVLLVNFPGVIKTLNDITAKNQQIVLDFFIDLKDKKDAQAR
jgi:phage RecT family recombinase